MSRAEWKGNREIFMVFFVDLAGGKSRHVYYLEFISFKGQKNIWKMGKLRFRIRKLKSKFGAKEQNTFSLLSLGFPDEEEY